MVPKDSNDAAMEGVNVAQAILSSVAVTLIVTPLLVLSYLAGRRSSDQFKTHRLDRLRSELSLGGTTWHAEFAGDSNPDAVEIVVYEMVQSASRIIGRGRSVDGTEHTLEGVVHLGRLCCIAIDENRDGIWLGAVTAELIPGQQRLTGMRTRWSPGSQTMLVRPVTLTRLDGRVQ